MQRLLELDLSRNATLAQIAGGATITVRDALTCRVIKGAGDGWYVYRDHTNRGEDPLVARDLQTPAEALEIAEAYADLGYNPAKHPEGATNYFLKDLPAHERPTEIHTIGEGKYAILPQTGVAVKIHENVCGEYFKWHHGEPK